MRFSRQARIITLLVIDTFFLFLELIVGYAVGSLALVADSFHMLNDVLSLIVALYTIKLATSPSSSENSYGWQRAEILGALINGVFLIALCVSIFIEAVGRLISPPEITSPKLIVIVGSFGLLSNIVGLFLFHDHGHGHGGHGGHDHGHSHSHDHGHGEVALPVEDDEPLQPTPIPRKRSDSMSSLYQHPAETRAQIIEAARLGHSLESESFLSGSPANNLNRSTSHSHSRRRSRVAGNFKAPAPGTNETLPLPSTAESSTPSTEATAVDESTPLLKTKSTPTATGASNYAADANAAENGGATKPPPPPGAHGSMNMRGVFLHVVGDALGNVGVISAGLVIWFCEGKWTLYFDPAVSLLITCIIFSSAVPLVKSASAILLQGVPEHVSLDSLREAIREVDGVVSVHELHVWQLSETTSVASVHVLIVPNSDHMAVSSEIRRVMHAQGIHSVTIQPEFSESAESDSEDSEHACLIRCPPDQCVGDTCCPPPKSTGQQTPRLGHVSEGDE